MDTRREFLQNTFTLAGILAASNLRQAGIGAEATDSNRSNSSELGPNMRGHLHIAALNYPRMDPIDFTGPFEVLSQLPDSTFHVAWKGKRPVRDSKGLVLTPEEALTEVPPLDILLVPGGPGQEYLMEDEAVISFVRDQSARARCVFSVCTEALFCGAAGLLKGARATTHWGAFDLLQYYEATPVNKRRRARQTGERRGSDRRDRWRAGSGRDVPGGSCGAGDPTRH